MGQPVVHFEIIATDALNMIPGVDLSRAIGPAAATTRSSSKMEGTSRYISASAWGVSA